MKKKIFLFTAVLLLAGIPYIIAWIAAGPRYTFGGLLFDPVDGYTYLAKMGEGWSGQWRFTLPYTADPGQGAYINLVYLFLGHLARLTTLPIIVVYHLARLAGGLFLVLALFRFFKTTFNNDETVWTAVLLALFGSGLGWIGLIFGKFTSDLWVAEAYPLLSLLTNPHFPISFGLMLWLLAEVGTPFSIKNGWLTALLALLLAIISPFCIAITGLVWAGMALWDQIEIRPFRVQLSRWARLACFLIGGLPMVVYQVWAISTDPILAGWNSQNVTPAPPVYDFLLSFSPALILAAAGGYFVLKMKIRPGRIFLVWVVMAVLLLYFPFNLQRRFLVGLYVPVAGLAILGLNEIRARSWMGFKWIGKLLIPASLPTVLIIFILALYGTFIHDPKLYLTHNEVEAFAWINRATPKNALILAGPDTGLVIPAFTGRRVIYGHPFETVNAVQEKAGVINYFSGGEPLDQAESYIAQRKVQYIYNGPAEKAIGKPVDIQQYHQVFQNAEVTIYEVP